MKHALIFILFITVAILCLAQVPVSDGPLGKVSPYPNQPDVWPPYGTPPMQLIPAGEYDMGDHHDAMGNAIPIHLVNIDAFFIDTYEVTNQEYCEYLNSAYFQFTIEVKSGMVYKKGDTEIYCYTYSAAIDSHIHWNGAGNGFTTTWGKESHPMVHVTWYGAVAYSNWRSHREGLTPCYNLNTWTCTFGAGGYRLPTEAEWEMAARGGNYTPYYRFPWGDSLVSTIANFTQSGDPYEAGSYPWTTPVGFYTGMLQSKTTFNWPGSQTEYLTTDGENGYGLYDMAGNVWEWCNDWYNSTYYSSSPYDNPKGPSSGTNRVLRGGSWYYYTYFLRCAGRDGITPIDQGNDVGFRLVLD
ncbi:MAG: SUMF1/EgtB/PvdO family nonheme iron enzyme [Planctomycetota bacterium]